MGCARVPFSEFTWDQTRAHLWHSSCSGAGMKLQVGGQTKRRAAFCNPVAREVGGKNSVRRLIGPVSGTIIAVCLCCWSLRAEEQISNDLDISQVTTSSQFTFYARPAAALLSVGSISTNATVQQMFPMPDDWWPHRSLTGDEARIDLRRDSPVTLLRKRLPSRNAYPVWAELRTGYGRIFEPETFGRSRTNGAGVVDPDWLHLKVCFKF